MPEKGVACLRDSIIKIRAAKAADDYSACLPLLTRLYHGDIGPNFKNTLEDFLNREDSIVLLAEHAGKAIGILVGSFHLDIDWEGKVAAIDALIVDETSRRSGVARKMVQRFVAEARERECKAIRSRINRKNSTAQGFHENVGFTRADTYEYILDLQEQGGG